MILEFVAAAPGKVGKREIAGAFDIRRDSGAVKELLRQLAADGNPSAGRPPPPGAPPRSP